MDFAIFIYLMKNAPLLGFSALVTLLFVVFTAVVFGTLRYFNDAAAEVISSSLSDSILGLFFPLFIFNFHLPLLLWFPLKRFHARATIQRSKGKLFLTCLLFMFLLNPITVMWAYGLAVKTPVGNPGFGMAALLVVAGCAAAALALGLWSVFFKRTPAY